MKYLQLHSEKKCLTNFDKIVRGYHLRLCCTVSLRSYLLSSLFVYYDYRTDASMFLNLGLRVTSPYIQILYDKFISDFSYLSFKSCIVSLVIEILFYFRYISVFRFNNLPSNKRFCFYSFSC